MEKYVNLFKRHVIHFKLDLCCFMAPVKSGLLAFACLHILIGISTLMFFVEESFEPLLFKVLNGLSEEDPPNYGPSCTIVYAVELGSNVVLLCGILRNDLILLRVYMYFAFGVLTAALMAYTVMFAPQVLTVKFLIAASIGHQIYMLLLLRSAMLEIKQDLKQNENDYAVRYRKTSVRYVPGTRDRYSVVIEPYRRRSTNPYDREVYRRSSSLVPFSREAYRRSSSMPYYKEEPKQRLVPVVQEHKGIEEEKATVILHSPAKEELAKEVVDKEETIKEVKGEEDKGKEVKRKRSFFGRKEKVKKDKSKNVTNDS
ncbi:uncharacterized protein LOC125235504 [Leguminivora glycinivorella]|uniref:uncharacterized protein LOC125235504 n=1 Tax=Leguminivora glycinivorella TaxID=1035111 RepID=UPI00200D6DC5|nr:uncharacterized protein LOC125235504 [Leguminivora glycinivorella]